MITALLVDDEPKAVDRLASLLDSFETVDVVGSAGTVDDAERFLDGRSVDVVFLDINMPGRLGIDLVARVPPGTKIVFVTAHEDYAIDAFREGAVDYVLKPVDRDRLAITLDRLGAELEPKGTDSDSPEQDGGEEWGEEAGEASADTADTVTLSSRRGRSIDVVPYTDIVWIEAVKNYSRVQTRGRRPRLIRRTMAEWERLLPESSFLRLSRSLVVQRAAIKSTQWQSRDQTLLFFADVKDPFPIGRTAAARLKDIMREN
jgi:two-component system LytT family response regulator